MHKTLFLSLDPDPTIGGLLLRYKRRVLELAGPQMFLDHPPHVTAYLANFSAQAIVLEAAKKLADEVTPQEISIIGWHVFERDQLTGGNTLVFQFDEATQRRLRTLQRKVVDCLAPLRHNAATKRRYRNRFANLLEVEKQSIEERGFPFTGANWHPHLTVASVRPDNWPPVAAELLAETPRIVGLCSSITVYRLQSGQPVAVKTFPLRRENHHERAG
ncbi:MAG TPA: 2'-5' RNA ligase family protein [Pirellulales bacterium]